jgi:hypothetical protein
MIGSSLVARVPLASAAMLALSMSYLAAPAMAENAAESSSSSKRVISFSGFDVSEDAHSFYSGALIALNGDFSRDGLVFRALGVVGNYQYDEATVPGGSVDADDGAYDVMIGYQATLGVFTATAYIGYEYRDIDLSPADPGNETQGSESGFKVAMDAQTSDEIPLFVSFSGAYSTAFDAYYAMLRTGYNAKRFVIGPEGLVGEIDGSEYQRLGGFVTYRFNLTPAMPAEITLNAGHQFVDDEDGGDGFVTSLGGEGAYGGVSMSFSF